MTTGQAASPKDAAKRLRAAVHQLAANAISIEPDPDALIAAAQLVEQAAAHLGGQAVVAATDSPTALESGSSSLRNYQHRSIFQGELHPFSPSLRWVDAEGPDGQPGYGFHVTLSQLYTGPPQAVHGGYVAALFDELLGGVQALAPQGGGYTGRLTVRYRSLTPIDTELRFVGWVSQARGRRITTHATCRAGAVLCAEAEALFVRPGTA